MGKKKRVIVSGNNLNGDLRGRDIAAAWIDKAADMPEIRECVKLGTTSYFDFDRPNNRHQRRKDAAEARRSSRSRK